MKNKYMVVEVFDQNRPNIKHSWSVMRGEILHKATEVIGNGKTKTVLTLTPNSIVETVREDKVTGDTQVKVLTADKTISGVSKDWNLREIPTYVNREKSPTDNLYTKVVCRHCGRTLGFAQGRAVIKCGKCKITTINE